MEDERTKSADRYLESLKQDERGKLKIYIGMSAGVGKTYRMLQDAHAMLKSGTNVKIGFVETHSRKETEMLLEGLPVLPRREVFYKGKQLEELDVNSILILHPEWVIVDELAHTNIPGSRNEKRFQDVIEILNAGINVVTAVNIQHIESINDEVRKITGIEVKERLPDSFLRLADEVVNIDLTSAELITRLKEGKIYNKAKVTQALNNFFKAEQILQLRELALKEVASQVERKVESEVEKPRQLRHEKFLACISSNHEKARKIIRKTSRLANYYNSDWFVLYVQNPSESFDKIPLDKQRHLLNNFQLANQLGAEVIQVQIANETMSLGSKSSDKITKAKSASLAETIAEVIGEREITTVCIGKPTPGFFERIFKTDILSRIFKVLSEKDVDLVVLS